MSPASGDSPAPPSTNSRPRQCGMLVLTREEDHGCPPLPEGTGGCGQLEGPYLASLGGLRHKHLMLLRLLGAKVPWWGRSSPFCSCSLGCLASSQVAPCFRWQPHLVLLCLPVVDTGPLRPLRVHPQRGFARLKTEPCLWASLSPSHRSHGGGRQI